MMILLTPAEADQVRGLSTPWAALQPRELTDGNFILPLSVLTDPAHAAKAEFLRSLPIVTPKVYVAKLAKDAGVDLIRPTA